MSMTDDPSGARRHATRPHRGEWYWLVEATERGWRILGRASHRARAEHAQTNFRGPTRIVSTYSEDERVVLALLERERQAREDETAEAR